MRLFRVPLPYSNCCYGLEREGALKKWFTVDDRFVRTEKIELNGLERMERDRSSEKEERGEGE